MPIRKLGLEFEEHEKIGRDPYAIRNRLTEIWATLGEAYTNKQLKSRHRAALKSIDNLRHQLNRLIIEEGHGLPEQKLSQAYYNIIDTVHSKDVDQQN